MRSKMKPKSWKNYPETMLKNSFGKKHQNDAKTTKNGSKTAGVEVGNCRFFRPKARPAPPRAPHMTPRRLPDPSGIDFSSFFQFFGSLWDQFSIMFWWFCLPNCAPKCDQHFPFKTKTAGVSPAEGRKEGRMEGRKEGRKEATKKSILQSARVSPYKQVDFGIGQRSALRVALFH